MTYGLKILFKSTVIASIFAGLGFLSQPVSARDIDVDHALHQALKKNLSDQQIYERVFGSNMPRGAKLDRIRFNGHLEGTGIHYEIPGNGIPAVPRVGDEARVQNCGSTKIVREVSLSTEDGESSDWSVTTGLSVSVGQEYSVGAEFEAGSSVFGGTLTGSAEMKTSWGINSSEEFNRGKKQSSTKSYSTSVSTTALPNKMYKVQLTVSERIAQDVPFEASFLASGDTAISFKLALGSQKVCLRNHAGKYLTAEDDKETVTWGQRGRTVCASWEHFIIEDGNGGDLESGDPVFVRTHFGRYWSARDNGDLDADRTEKKSWERFTLGKVGGSSGTRIVSGDQVSFLGKHGQYVVANDDNKLHADRPSRGSWETFTVTLAEPAPTRTIRLESLLSETQREIALKGKFNGSFTHHQDDIYAIDFDITAECDKKRAEATGTTTHSKAAKAVSSFDIKKLEEKGLVSVTKATKKDLKKASPIHEHARAIKLEPTKN